MKPSILVKSLSSEHRHEYTKPVGRLANPQKGLFFLLWQCTCGKEKASDLLPREKIEELAKQYKQRVSAKAAFSGDASLIDKKGQGEDVL